MLHDHLCSMQAIPDKALSLHDLGVGTLPYFEDPAF
jgi:hypothetical protein